MSPVNNYSRLSHLKAQALGAGAGTTRDSELLRTSGSVARWIDEQCGRHFFSRIATLYPDWSDDGDVAPGLRLWLPEDLISVTSVKVDEDGDGAFETSLVADTDYWLWPDSPLPYRPYLRIDLNPNGGLPGGWSRGRRRVQVVGKWGWSEQTNPAGTLGAAITDTTGTSVTMTGGHSVEAGDTILVDSEQMDVTVVSSNTLTVARGINGTTAATHLNNAPVSARRYPEPIEEAARERTNQLARVAMTGGLGSVAVPDVGGFSGDPGRAYAALMGLIRPFMRVVI